MQRPDSEHEHQRDFENSARGNANLEIENHGNGDGDGNQRIGEIGKPEKPYQHGRYHLADTSEGSAYTNERKKGHQQNQHTECDSVSVACFYVSGVVHYSLPSVLMVVLLIIPHNIYNYK